MDRLAQVVLGDISQLHLAILALWRIGSTSSKELIHRISTSVLESDPAMRGLRGLRRTELVNILNVTSKSSSSVKFNEELVRTCIPHLADGSLDHRSGSLLVASISRMSPFRGDPDIKQAVSAWCVSQRSVGNLSEWTPQSVSLFVYSASKLLSPHRSPTNLEIKSFVDALVQSRRDDWIEFTNQNTCNLIGGLSVIGGMESAVDALLVELSNRTLHKKDLFFLFKSGHTGVSKFAIDSLCANGAMTLADVAIVCDLASRQEAVLARLPCEVDRILAAHHIPSTDQLFYVLHKLNYSIPDFNWDIPFDQLSAEKAARVLFTIWKLDMGAPAAVTSGLVDAVITGNGTGSGCALALLALASTPTGLPVIGSARVDALLARLESSTLDEVDARQVAKAASILRLTGDPVLADRLSATAGIGLSHRLPPVNSSRVHVEVERTLNRLLPPDSSVIKEVHVPDISLFIDLVVIPS